MTVHFVIISWSKKLIFSKYGGIDDEIKHALDHSEKSFPSNKITSWKFSDNFGDF